jgi:hypothetical protein
MNENVKFEKILDESLDRVLLGDVKIDAIVENYPRWKNQLKSALETAQWLIDQGNQMTPRPGFINSNKLYITSSLLVMNLRRDYDFKAFYKRVFFRRILLAIVVIGLIFSAGGGLVIVGDESLPGDIFYPLRIATENIRLALTLQPSKEAYLHLQYAQEHLIACAMLVSHGRYNHAQVALNHYERHMSGAGRLVPVLSQNGLNADQLFSRFNRIFLQDFETIQVLLPGGF